MMRRKQLLFLLLVVLAGSLVYAYYRMPRQQTVVDQTKASLPGQSVRAVEQRQELLLPEPFHPPVTIARDIFLPAHLAEAQAAARKAAVVKPPPPPPPPPPPTPAEIARQQVGQFKSLGILKQQGRQVAFLAKGGKILLVRVGDSIISGYTVSAISDTQLNMRADDGDEIKLGLR